MVTTTMRKAKCTTTRHRILTIKRTFRCDTSIRTTPDALLRLIRQRWSNCFAEAWRLRE